MKLDVQKDYPLIPAREHIFKLVSCDFSEMDDKFGARDAVNGKVKRLKFRFVSQEEDEDGTPYDYAVITGLTYGNEKAGLTRLIDMLVPGMTVEKFADFDTDDLVGKKFRAQIKHTKNEQGKPKADYVYMAPVAKAGAKPAAPAAKAADDDDGLADPFADD